MGYFGIVMGSIYALVVVSQIAAGAAYLKKTKEEEKSTEPDCGSIDAIGNLIHT
jgi:hypothetical protein